MESFDKIKLADAEIKSITDKGNALVVGCTDWQANDFELIFHDLISYQCFSAQNRDLSHGTVSTTDPFIAASCRLAEEEASEEFKLFTFVSARDELGLLAVVAKQVTRSVKPV